MHASIAATVDVRPRADETGIATARSRIAFLDLARVAATLMMVCGHTVDALLDGAYRDTQAFHAWTWARGLTPSTFLFVSGFAFGIVTFGAAGRRAGDTARRLRRGAFLVAAGYALHYPAVNALDLWTASPEAWRSFIAVDVLQAIGITLIILQLLVVTCRSPRRFLPAALILAAAVAAFAPLVWSFDWTAYVIPAIAAYFSPHAGSLFPLFPWLAYGALGAAASAWFLLDTQAAPVGRAFRTLLPAGLLMYGAALACRQAGWEPVAAAGVGGARVSQFLLQAGLVCLIVSAIAAMSSFVRRRSVPVEALARHSLIVYVVHICLIYGSPWVPGLRQLFGRTLPPITVLGVVMTMWGLMAILTVGWHHCTRHRPILARRLRFGIIGTLALILLL